MKTSDIIPRTPTERMAITQDKFLYLLEDICAKMERTRITYNFTQQEFADMLGVSKHQYLRILNSPESHPGIKALFSFCYVFGYDLQTLYSNIVSANATDAALLEVAASLGGASAQVIKDMMIVVEDSDMTKLDKTRLNAALEKYLIERNNFKENWEKRAQIASLYTVSADAKDDEPLVGDEDDDVESIIVDE